MSARTSSPLDRYLRSVGIDPVYYIDTPSTGDTQLPDSAQTAAAIDGFPNNVQWAIYPEGAFIGVDSGSLELGLVRDSTLNSTNDFQIFGERFRNVARLAPVATSRSMSAFDTKPPLGSLFRGKKVPGCQCAGCAAGWSMPPVILPSASSATDILTPPFANTRS